MKTPFFASFQGILRWISNAPLSFSAFNNYQFGKTSSACRDCSLYVWTLTHYVCQKLSSRTTRLLKPSPCPNLSTIKTHAASIMHPQLGYKQEKCTLLLLSNLAAPEWLSVACNKNLLLHVLCHKRNRTNEKEEKLMKRAKLVVCPLEYIEVGNTCFFFKFVELRDTAHFFVPVPARNALVNATSMQNLTKVFFSVQAQTPKLFFANNTPNHISGSLLCTKHFWSTQCSRTDFVRGHPDYTEGFAVTKQMFSKIVQQANHHPCTDGSIVMTSSVCDGREDCPDASDESNCVYSVEMSFMCKEVFCNENHRSTCGFLYHTTPGGKCHHFVRRARIGRTETKERVNCSENSDTFAAGLVWWNDMFVDCHNQAVEEDVLFSFLINGVQYSCSNAKELPCRQGHTKCYNITNICIYTLNIFGHLSPCRNGGHLEECTEFQCNTKFKCLLSYCISWELLCNGRWDCTHGDDEQNATCSNHVDCADMFRCKKILSCVHVGDTCNNKHDCPLGDDEELCEISHHQCPLECLCLGLATTCKFLTKSHNASFSGYLFISISNSESLFQDNPKSIFISAYHLYISQNKIQKIHSQGLPPELLYLNASCNNIAEIALNCFPNTTQVLLFDENKTKNILSESSAGKKRLKLLSLSNNPLIHFEANSFKSFSNINVLFLINVPLVEKDNNVFKRTKVNMIFATQFQVCCHISQTTICKPDTSWHVSCFDLIPWQSVKSFYISVSVLIILTSVISIVTHMILSRLFHVVFRMTVVFLSMTDLLCAIYFGTVWISHFVLSNRFSVHYHSWISGATCFFAFGVILWFLILAQVMLFFFSVCRLMVVLHPMDTNFKRTSFVGKLGTVCFVISFLISLLLTMVVKETLQKVPMTLCLPSLDPSHELVTIRIIIWFEIISQIVSSVEITIVNIILVYKLRESQKSLRKSKYESNTIVAFQLALITVTNVLCWCPVSIVNLTTEFLAVYPDKLITWFTIIALPINSFVNPVIFTALALRRHLKDRKQAQVKKEALDVG